MAEKSTVARPYAQAAFELAREQEAFADWSQLLATCAAVASDASMSTLLANPQVPRETTAEIFAEICADALGALGRNFVHVLGDNRRLDLLPEIAVQYEILRAEAERTIEAQVVAAFELDAAQQQMLAAALKSHLGREVKLVCKVDKSLLGGAVVHAGDLVIDGSALGKLGRLAGQIQG